MKDTYSFERSLLWDQPAADSDINLPALYDQGLISADKLFDSLPAAVMDPAKQPAKSPDDSEVKDAQVSSDTIRVPINRASEARAYGKIAHELSILKLKVPTPYDVAKILHIPAEEAIEFERVLPLMQAISYEQVKDYLESKEDPYTPDDGEHITIEDLLVDEGLDLIYEDEEVIKRLSVVLDSVLSELTDKEREVIERRFGLGSFRGEVQTQEEVGEHFGVTRERIRQIEAKTLRKLRHPERVNRLEEFHSHVNDDSQYGMRAVIQFTPDDDAVFGIERARAYGDENPIVQKRTYAERQTGILAWRLPESEQDKNPYCYGQYWVSKKKIIRNHLSSC